MRIHCFDFSHSAREKESKIVVLIIIVVISKGTILPVLAAFHDYSELPELKDEIA